LETLVDTAVTIKIYDKTIDLPDIKLSDIPLEKLVALLEQTSHVTFTVRSTPKAVKIVQELAHLNGMSNLSHKQLLTLASPIEQLSLDTRCKTSLIIDAEPPHLLQLEFIWELCEKTESEVRRIKRIGAKSLTRIVESLAKQNLTLGMKDEIGKIRHLLPKREP
jgi:hypothetical protein